MAGAKMESPGGNRGSTKVSSSVSTNGLYTRDLQKGKEFAPFLGKETRS